jgi:hypothetical protein
VAAAPRSVPSTPASRRSRLWPIIDAEVDSTDSSQGMLEEFMAAWISPLVQLLGHQDAAQVTLARAAWPLRLGWKKSRVLTWLALNW